MSRRSRPLAERARIAARNIPVPELHLGCLAASLVLRRLRPMPLGTGRPAAWPVGIALIGAGVALAGWAVAAADTTDLAMPDRLVTRGPYAWIRHPMYVGWTLAYVGIAVTRNDGWLGALLLPLTVLIRREARAEERALRARFGSRYDAYAIRVRIGGTV
jgi:protein-S-isoprenylcysteine O-methyltransferase Ste14